MIAISGNFVKHDKKKNRIDTILKREKTHKHVKDKFKVKNE